jgi:hypothetical protein
MVSITCAGARFYKLLYRRVDLAFGSSKSEIVRDVILQVFPFFDRHDQRLWVACTKLYTDCTRGAFCSLLLPTELNDELRRFVGQVQLPKQDLGLPDDDVVVSTRRFLNVVVASLEKVSFVGPVHVSRGPWHGLAAPTQRRQAPLTLSSWALSYKRRRVVDNSAVY